jgi:hypothetical protein
MQIIQPVKRGGRRRDVGRPKGTGRYGEPTMPVRVPANLVCEVEVLIQRRKFTRPLYEVGGLPKLDDVENGSEEAPVPMPRFNITG